MRAGRVVYLLLDLSSAHQETGKGPFRQAKLSLKPQFRSRPRHFLDSVSQAPEGQDISREGRNERGTAVHPHHHQNCPPRCHLGLHPLSLPDSQAGRNSQVSTKDLRPGTGNLIHSCINAVKKKKKAVKKGKLVPRKKCETFTIKC